MSFIQWMSGAKRSRFAILAAASVFATGCATSGDTPGIGASTAGSEVTAAAISVTKDGVPPHLSTAATIFPTFEGSPSLTAALRNAIADAGYRIAESEARADLVLRFDGAFQALRPGTRRTAELRAGPYAESPGPVPTRSGRGGQMMLSANPLTIVLGTIGQNVGDATSMQDRFNQRVAGDPDGVCLSTNCTSWEYQQRAVIVVEHATRGRASERFASTASAQMKRLIPQPLFQAALDDISASLKLHVPFRFERAGPRP